MTKTNCYIPTNELTQEQIDKLNNITFQGCNCQTCKKDFGIYSHDNKVTIHAIYGHANKEKLRLYLSRPFFGYGLREKLPFRETLFLAIGTVLHETIHILFPEYNEYEVSQKEYEWLKRNLILEILGQPPTKEELIRLGYSLKDRKE